MSVLKDERAQNNPIRLRRESLGLSRADLARRSGAAYVALTGLETGLPCKMSALSARRIAPFLNAEADALRLEYAAFRAGMQEPEAA